MAGVATCTVNRRSTQYNYDADKLRGFYSEAEMSYPGTILSFETHQAYVSKDADKKVYLIPIQDLSDVEPA